MKRHKNMSKNMTFGGQLAPPGHDDGFHGISANLCVCSLKNLFMEEANKNY